MRQEVIWDKISRVNKGKKSSISTTLMMTMILILTNLTALATSAKPSSKKLKLFLKHPAKFKLCRPTPENSVLVQKPIN